MHWDRRDLAVLPVAATEIPALAVWQGWRREPADAMQPQVSRPLRLQACLARMSLLSLPVFCRSSRDIDRQRPFCGQYSIRDEVRDKLRSDNGFVPGQAQGAVFQVAAHVQNKLDLAGIVDVEARLARDPTSCRRPMTGSRTQQFEAPILGV